MPLRDAVERSWEQLTLEANAHAKKKAAETLQWMVAAQGDTKSWERLRDELTEILKRKI